MNDQNDIKVLVKKSDGTFIHVSLSELNKKNEGKTDPAVAMPTPSQSVSEPKQTTPPVNLPVEGALPKEINKTNIKPGTDLIENARLEKEIPAVVTNQINFSKSQNKPEQAKNKSSVKFGLPTLTEAVIKKTAEPVINAEKDDYSSLLEEKLPTVSKIVSLTSSGREKQVDAVLNSLSFKVSSENISRMKTVVQLFLKEVRGETETVEILRRREIEGGLGLSDDEAKEVIEKSKKSVSTDAIIPVPVLMEKKFVTETKSLSENKKINTSIVDLNEKENKRLESELPTVIKKPSSSVAPANFLPKITPIVNQSPIKPDEPKKTIANDSKKELDDQVTRSTLVDAPVEPFRISPGQIKPTMFDVRRDPVSMGPVDEIRSFNLVDFRRLSTDPAEAASRLKQKLINLREESIVLYFEGWEAWKESPLYHDYINAVAESIAKRMPLAKVTTERSKIQLVEISALVKMEKQLG